MPDDVRAPDTHITDDMVAAAAQGAVTECGRGDLSSLEPGDQDYFRRVALAALRTGLAGAREQTTVHADTTDGLAPDHTRQVEVIAGYLVVPVEGCTCDGGGEFPHRAECGYEPAVPLAEVEAAIARARRAEGHADTAVTDDMVEAAAKGLYDEVAYQATEWDDARVRDQDVFRQHAKVALSAALAGYTVVRLPEPNTVDVEGDPAWTVTGTADGPDDVVAYVLDGQPRVSAIGAPDEPDAVEAYALTLLAAAREARRLAAGSQVGDQHG